MSQPVMRVLWVIDYFPRPHDQTTGVWALETIRALQEQGVEVAVFSPTPWVPQWLAWTRALRDWSCVPDEWQALGVPVYFAKCLHYPHRFITRWLYHHLPWLDSWLVWWTCRGAIARVLERFPAQVIHANFIFPGGFLGWRINRRYGLPLVVHEHSPQRLQAAQSHPWRRRIYQRVITEADAVLTPNNRLAGLLQAMAPGQRIQAIPSGMPVALPGSMVVPKPAPYAQAKVVLSVGALNERKGQEYLIRAIGQVRREIPNVQCLIIGQGAQQAALERLIRELGLQDCVELCGPRPHQEVLAAMAWCDVFALPSWGESFGAVYVEAMACGKPVIACEGEGFSDFARDGVHALLVKPRDVTSLVEALRRLLTDRPFASALGAQGRTLAAQELSCRSMAERTVALYRQVLNGHPASAATRSGRRDG